MLTTHLDEFLKMWFRKWGLALGVFTVVAPRGSANATRHPKTIPSKSALKNKQIALLPFWALLCAQKTVNEHICCIATLRRNCVSSYVVKMKDFDLKSHIIRKNYIFNFYGLILLNSIKNLLGQNAQYTTRYIPWGI